MRDSTRLLPWLGIFLACISAAHGACPSGWQEVGPSCYQFVTAAASWSSASSDCISKGGHLATFESASDAGGVLSSASTGYWIGASKQSGAWSFVDSTPASGLPGMWQPGEPDGVGNSVCAFHCCGAASLGDDVCSASKPYICEIKAPCAAGYFEQGPSKTCTECPAGAYGIDGKTCAACPEGTYGSTTGLTSASCSGKCQTGHYCPAGSKSPTEKECPAGTYGASTGLTTAACSGQCAPGHYCPAKSTAATGAGKCPAGTYGGAGQTTSACAGPCAAGYTCPSGSTTATAVPCGSQKLYCPAGSATAVSVSAGFYTTGGSGDTTRTAQTACEPGNYCVDGVKTQCVAGRYGASTGLATANCDGLCDPGYTCPAGSTSAQQRTCTRSGFEPQESYCPRGSVTPQAVPAGYYSVPEDAPLSARSDIRACTADYVCTKGLRYTKLRFLGDCARGADVASFNENTAGTHNLIVIAGESTESPAKPVSFSMTSSARNTCGSTGIFSLQTVSSTSVRLVASGTVDHETCPWYVATITLTAGSFVRTCDVRVNVADLNDQPTVVTPPTLNLDENSPIGAPVLNSELSGADQDLGQELNYAIQSGNEAGHFQMSACSGELRVAADSIDFETKSSYTFVVHVTDNGSPQKFVATTVVLNINDVHEAPVFTVSGFTVPERSAVGTALTPEIAAVTDEDGGATHTWQITRNDDAMFQINTGTGALRVAKAGLNYEFKRTYNIEIRVTDNDGLRVVQSFDIQVLDQNDPPALSAARFNTPEYGPHADPTQPAMLELGYVTASDEDKGTVFTYSIQGGNTDGAFAINGASGVLSATLAKLDFEAQPFRELLITVTDDGMGNSGQGMLDDSRYINVTVTDMNEKPSISPQSISIPEDTAVDSVLGQQISVQDNDNANGPRQSHGFTIAGQGQTMFRVDPLTGQLVLRKPLDYETQTNYSIIVTARDSGYPALDSDAQEVVVTITDVNEPPVLVNANLDVNENKPASTVLNGGALQCSDVDAGDNAGLKYSIQGGERHVPGTSDDVFALNSATGVVSLTAAGAAFVDFEVRDMFSIDVRCKDPDGLYSDATLFVKINDINEKPTLADTLLAAPEQSAVGALVGALSGYDQDRQDQITYALETPSTTYPTMFRLAPTGEMYLLEQAPLHDAVNASMTVRVTDSAGASSTGIVTVDFLNTNLRPTIPDHTVTKAEDFEEGGVLVADLAGADRDGDTLTYRIHSVRPSRYLSMFYIAKDTATLRLAATSKFDFETQNNFTVVVIVKDDGQGELEARAAVEITVTDVPEKPIFLKWQNDLAGAVIPEDTSAGTVIDTVVATDPDINHALTYTVEYDGFHLYAPFPFEMNPSSGVLTLKSQIDYDREDVQQISDTFKLLVTITDEKALFVTTALEVTITDVNEPITLLDSVWSVVEGEALLGDMDAFIQDPEYARSKGQLSLDFSIDSEARGDEAMFEFVGRVLQLKAGAVLDFEDRDSYSLVVRVNDGVQDDTATVQVRVNDTNDAAITALSGELEVNTAGNTDWVYITGKNLGPTSRKMAAGAPAGTITATYGTASEQYGQYSMSGCEIVTPNTLVRCNTTAGRGAGYSIQLTVDGKWATPASDPLLSYKDPVITAVQGANAIPLLGQTSLTLTGHNFGPITSVGDDAIAVLFGDVHDRQGFQYEALNCRVTVANSEIVCDAPPTLGADLSFTVMVDGQWSGWFSAPAGAPRFGSAKPVVSKIVTEAALLDLGFGQVADDSAVASIVDQAPSAKLSSAGAEPFWVFGQHFERLVLLSRSQELKIGVKVAFTRRGVTGSLMYNATECALRIPPSCLSTECSTFHIRCLSPPGVGSGHNVQVTLTGDRLQNPVVSEWSTAVLMNYGAPEITIVGGKTFEAAAKGGDVVTLFGSMFPTRAEFMPLTTITYGHNANEYTAVGCTVAPQADGTLECKLAAGVGANLSWKIKVDNQVSPVFNTTTQAYHPPLISEVELVGGGGAAPTAGGELVAITGLHFGRPSFPVTVRALYGPADVGFVYEARNCTVIRDERVECRMQAGVGLNLRWKLIIDGQESRLSSTNYDVPRIFALDGPGAANASSAGGQVVLITGENFGPVGSLTSGKPSLQRVTYGPVGREYTAKNCTVLSHTQIRCHTVPATGSGLRWTVTVADQVGETSTVTTSIRPAYFESMQPQVGPTTGGYNITDPNQGGGIMSLRVTNLPLDDPLTTIIALFGDLQLPVFSAQQLLARVAAGVLKVSKAERATLDTVAAQDASSSYRSDDAVRFVVIPEYYGTGRPVRLQVTSPAGTHITNARKFSYHAPRIEKFGLITNSNDPSGRTLLLTLQGEHFGNADPSSSVELQDGSGAYVILPTVKWSHTEAILKVNVTMQELRFTMTVMSGAWQQQSPVTKYVKRSPMFSSRNGAEVNGPFATAGGEELVLYGNNLEPCATTNCSISVTITSGTVKECPLIQVNPVELVDEATQEYKITCTMPPGSGKDNVVTILYGQSTTTNGPGSGPSQAVAIDFKPPTISRVFNNATGGIMSTEETDWVKVAVQGRRVQSVQAPDDTRLVVLVPSSGAEVTIEGSNFGRTEDDVRLGPFFPMQDFSVMYRGAGATSAGSCRLDMWSHDRLHCTIPEGDGTLNELNLVVNGQWLSQPVYINYTSPVIERIYPSVISTAGGDWLWIFGSNFGRFAPVVSIGGKPCELLDQANEVGELPVTSTPGQQEFDNNRVRSYNHSVIVCSTPVGQGPSHRLSVVTRHRSKAINEEALPLQYQPPNVGFAWPSVTTTRGGETMCMLGRNFGMSDLMISLVPANAEDSVYDVSRNVTLHNHTHICFTSIEGHGGPFEIRTTVSGQTNVVGGMGGPLADQMDDQVGAVMVSYADPVMHSISPDRGDTKGNYTMTILGDHFGPNEATVTVKVGGNVCTRLQHNHTWIECTVPAGWGTENPVEVIVDSDRASAKSAVPAEFNYNPPIILSIVPNVPDARGQGLNITGRNFGPGGQQGRYINVTLSNTECVNASVINDADIRCSMPEVIVGTKLVRIQIDAMISTKPFTLEPQCKEGWYGTDAELCSACTTNLDCDGAKFEPKSSRGAWLFNRTLPDDACLALEPAPRHNRSYCYVGMSCVPTYACSGDNTCSNGYTGDRCNECMEGYYRLNGDCEVCPDMLWLKILLGLLVLVALGAAAYLLSRKDVPLAYLSIGVDYFQILAIFARSKVVWPTIISQLLNNLELFNFSIDFLSPECAMQGVSFWTKWTATESAPFALLVVLCTWHMVLLGYKRFIKAQRAEALWSHSSTLISLYLLVCYVLYLHVTRSALEMLNCVEPEVADGNSYLDALPSEPCYESGGTHMLFFPLAIMALLVYSVGFPAWVGQLLYRNKLTIKKDQILRAMETGNSEASNPTAFAFRKRFHKLYYQFKPGKWYWVMLILGRKFLISYSSLMFRRTPSFQFAMCLLVLFAAFVAHTRHRPFMSPSSFDDVVNQHYNQRATDPVHQQLGEEIKKEQATLRAYQQSNTARRAAAQKANREAASMFLFDYNTVETVMLACAIIVTLSGIMFESNEAAGDYYDGQKDVVGYLVFFVILFSIVYFALVVAVEITQTLRMQKLRNQAGRKTKPTGAAPQAAQSSRNGLLGRVADKLFGGPQSAHDQALRMRRRLSLDQVTEQNPMFNRVENPMSTAGDLREAKQQTALLQNEVEALRAENNKLRAQLNRD